MPLPPDFAPKASGDNAPPISEEKEGSDMLVAIQWHIWALTGSERDVASGSVRTRVYVVLLFSVRVGMVPEAWIANTGSDLTALGFKIFPRLTDLCFEG